MAFDSTRAGIAERRASGEASVSVRPGLEVLLDDPRPIAGKKIGLVTNQSAVTSDLRHAVRVLHAGRGWKLIALFGPEHGIWGEAQDMEGVEQSDDPGTRRISRRGAKF
ncbi:MAG: hypothetical protein DMF59_20610 [Acidobacteria bacterium]|nr:MAG: hypothetical protein DMF59_20610 [Acidobacteriota bacterium]